MATSVTIYEFAKLTMFILRTKVIIDLFDKNGIGDHRCNTTSLMSKPVEVTIANC